MVITTDRPSAPVAPGPTEPSAAMMGLAPSPEVASRDDSLRLVSGWTFAISSPAGDMVPEAPHGLFHRDTRMLSRLQLLVNGSSPDCLSARALSPLSARFVLAVPWRGLGESPLVAVRNRRIRRGLSEELEITNHGVDPARLVVEVRVDADFADIAEVKSSDPPRRRQAVRRAIDRDRGAIVFHQGRSARRRTEVIVHGGPCRLTRSGVRFDLVVEPKRTWRARLDVLAFDARRHRPPARPPAGSDPARMVRRAAAWRAGFPEISSSWEELDRLFRRSVHDLSSLLMEDDGSGDLVVAAGMPWFMTLFGRDAILASLMALPFDRRLARGVLRGLARRQGCVHDENSEEEPGKILHELRFGDHSARGGRDVYFGTVDATPLFVVLAAEAWKWGLPWHDVRPLLPNVRRALDWMRNFGDIGGDGYLAYRPRPEPGLRNQGWKDSWDGIQFADGRLPSGPIALCEVQAYAYMAFVDAARLLEEAGDATGARRAREEAQQLARRFLREFWMAETGYPALALDGEGRQIDAVASNAAHLLWTGILPRDRAESVARRLVSDDLFSGWGIRTLATSNRGFNPVSYHAGSVWPHDTAIAAGGLARLGYSDEARTLIKGLVDASSSLGDRLPELFCGFSREEIGFPVRYPPTCSPQAWSAASALLLLRTLLGLRADVPRGILEVDPILPAEALPFHLEGMRIGSGRLSLSIVEEGVIRLYEVPEGLEVRERASSTPVASDTAA